MYLLMSKEVITQKTDKYIYTKTVCSMMILEISLLGRVVSIII